MPDFNVSASSNCKMASRRRKFQGSDGRLEREVVKRNAARDVGENRMSVFVDGEEKVASWGKTEARDVLAVGEWEGVRFVTR